MIQVELWQGGAGDWHVTCFQDLAHNSGAWYIIPRALGIPLSEYLELVITKYKPDRFYHNDSLDFFNFSWTDKIKANAFKLDINKMLKQC